MATQSKVIKLLIDIVFHPDRYRFVMYMPGPFDAAEFLYENFFDELPASVTNKCESILVASGKYQFIKLDNNHVNHQSTTTGRNEDHRGI